MNKNKWMNSYFFKKRRIVGGSFGWHCGPVKRPDGWSITDELNKQQPNSTRSSLTESTKAAGRLSSVSFFNNLSQ